jgi:glycosyltransferase involved in cell wall biosynthesis
MTAFRIHSIVLVKNEADIIAHCLKEAAKWSDFIYVYDNGSTDGTWEIVRALSSPQIIPFKQDRKPFREHLRAEVFAAFRSNARCGDWWCRLDADELYLDDPRAFLGGLRAHECVVWGLPVEYYLTLEDITLMDFSRPIDEVLSLIRHYKITWSETRFFKYRDSLKWRPPASWPRHMGPVAISRIRYRHYKYRSPSQIQLRLAVRQESRRNGFQGWDHAKETDWHQKLVVASTVEYDGGDSELKYDQSILPDHRGSLGRRAIKRLMHGLRIWR